LIKYQKHIFIKNYQDFQTKIKEMVFHRLFRVNKINDLEDNKDDWEVEAIV